MRILIAPDSFKESMTASQAANAIARGLRAALGPSTELDLCPVADGGEGTLDALVAATGGIYHNATVTGPLAQPVDAKWAMLGDRHSAVVEMAQAAGLDLVPPDRRDPTATTTYGVGQLILHALNAGAGKIIVCIGGSATTDAGTATAQALGARFFSSSSPSWGEAGRGAPHYRARIKSEPHPTPRPKREGRGKESEPLTGADLQHINSLDLSPLDPRLSQTQITVACDVTNPLYGPEGAAHIYAPQKGATPDQVAQLDTGLRRLASLLPHIDPHAPGMGAAGGLGFGLVAFCNAKLVRGIDLVLDAVRFHDRARRADLVITGEGRLDAQSIQGKTCIGVARAAAQYQVKTIALVGAAGPGADQSLQHGLSAYHSILGTNPELSPAQAMTQGPKLLESLAASVISSYA